MPDPACADERGLPAPGDLIAGKYRIERMIGKGGMAAVFSAHHELLGDRVAVKFLLGTLASGPEATQRFVNEARNAFKIKGEHACAVLDVGATEAGLPYMVLEYLEGRDLAQLLEQDGPLRAETAVDYVVQAIEAVAQAHALGIVHRDLKPANLFLAERPDGSVTVKVLDFGISKATNPLAEEADLSLTSTTAMLGSPLYMSPEQLRSSKHVDPRSDIWALGVIVYELVAGRLPFNGQSLGELFVALLEQPPVPLCELQEDVPEALSHAVMRCLERAPEARFQNVAELAQALAPSGSVRAFASVERIAQTLGVPPAALAGAAAVGAQTGASWGSAAGSLAPKSRAPAILGAGVALLLFAGGAAAGLALLGRSAASGAPSGSAAPAPVSASAAAMAPAQATAISVASALASASPPLAPAADAGAPATAASASTRPASPGPRNAAASAPARPAPSAPPASLPAAPIPAGPGKAFDPFGGR